MRKKNPTDTTAKALGGAPRTRHRFRIRLVLWAFLAAYAAVGLRLAQLQLHPDDKYHREDSKHVGTVQILLPRGGIYDRNGVVLATDKRVYSLWADPRRWAAPDRAQEAQRVAARLASELQLDHAETLARLQRTDANGAALSFSWVKRWMAEEEVDRLTHAWVNRRVAEGKSRVLTADAMLEKGLYIRPEPLRFYPQGELAAHVVGFANLERKGGEGVELLYDKYLDCKPGLRKSRKDAMRNLLNSLTLEYQEPEGGDDVYLTIDATIQQTLEDELDKAMEFAKAPRAMGLVMDPRTGAILALACRPAFNPNRFWEYQDFEIFKNRAVIDAFEPGSSFKIVAASAALEEELITPEYTINCENGGFSPYGHRISDYHPLGVEPFSTCFAQSSNVAIIKVGAMLGPERMESWIRRFGFGQRTSRDFGKESVGLFRPRKQWSRLSMGSLPMGQEIMVTMPQLARAFAAIANGGCLVEPYLVDRAVGRDGVETYDRTMPTPKRILSPETAATMRELCHLVTLGGTGERARIEEYRVGGKTGTAQIAEPGRGYVPGKFTAIFAGFAPLEEPRVVTVIVVQEPAIALHFGGYICGPVFATVVREALVRMNCPPDAVPEEKLLETPGPVEEADPDTVLAEAEWTGDEPSPDGVLGSLTGLELVGKSKDPSGGPVLPDLTGLTKAQARARIAALGLTWDAEGSGWVATQDPPAGTPLRDVSLCRLVFSDERTQDGTDGGNERDQDKTAAQ